MRTQNLQESNTFVAAYNFGCAGNATDNIVKLSNNFAETDLTVDKYVKFLPLSLPSMRVIGSKMGGEDALLSLMEIKKSPFEVIEERRRIERRALIERIRKMSFRCAKEICERLADLIEITEDEHPDGELISVSSLRDFGNFLGIGSDWLCPEIGISSRGNISAEWLIDDSHHIAVEFLGRGRVKFAMFAPDINQPEKTVPMSGMPTIEGLLEAVSPFSVREWITHG